MARDPFHLAWRTPRRWHVEGMAAAVGALAAGERPLLAVTTGAGKTDWTCHAAWLAAVEGGGHQGAVILVPTEALVEQTYEALVKRATVNGTHAPLFSSGRWYGRKKEAGADVVVCCYPSLPSLVLEWAVDGRRPHLLIVDEAHGSEADTVRAAVEQLDPRRIVGLTATPYRSGAGEKLGMFSTVAYSYSYAEAVAERVLVPRRIVVWEGDGQRDVDDVAWDMLSTHAPRRPDGRIWRTVVDADSIADVERYAAWLRDRGVAAAGVHSQLGRAQVDAAVEDLRAGVLDVVVHCNLLSEGVDLPWLRCYALRNRTESRNRLVQRVGRVLRPDPDDPTKDHGLILDPWNLCRIVGLDHDAELGESEDVAEKKVRTVRDWEKLPPKERERRLVEALLNIEVWVARLRLACEAAGLIPPPTYPPGAWQRRAASEKQRAALGRLRWASRYLPSDDARKLLRGVCDAPGLTGGVASDTMAILRALAEGSRDARAVKRHWAAPIEDDTPEGAQQVLALDARARERA